jgi:hypothetical protein
MKKRNKGILILIVIEISHYYLLFSTILTKFLSRLLKNISTYSILKYSYEKIQLLQL